MNTEACILFLIGPAIALALFIVSVVATILL